MSSTHRLWSHLFMIIALLASVGVIQPSLSTTHAQTPQTYTVDRADDVISGAIDCDGDLPDDNCTLRRAIELANSDGGASRIIFDIPPTPNDAKYNYDTASGRWTIKPNGSELPPIGPGEGNTIISGPVDELGLPEIILDGSDAGNNAVGFRILSANNQIDRFIIGNFKGTLATAGFGIRITSSNATDNLITGNFIGHIPDNPPVAVSNQRGGIVIDTNANGNQIGDANDPGRRNIISGNGQTGTGNGDGIFLFSGVNETVIQGNYIGVLLNQQPLGNAGYGIQVNDSDNNRIGGTSANERNVIAGNELAGVALGGTLTFSNTIAGNYIGLALNGLTPVGNGEDGVQIVNGARGNIVSGAAGARSIISGNAGYGIRITSSNPSIAGDSNQILGNYIGVDRTGSTPMPNDEGGVRIENNVTGNTIGQGNVISGNTGYGVSIGRTSPNFLNTTENAVSGNIIGLNSIGTTARPNTLGGVLVDVGTFGNTVGGTSETDRNIISGNGGPGVTVSETLSTTITTNIIGLRKNNPAASSEFDQPAPNTGSGVVVNNSTFTRIGGPTEIEGNIISGNAGNGIELSNSTETTIEWNDIGTYQTPEDVFLSLGNTQNGIQANDSLSATILMNNIHENTLNGVLVADGSQDIAILENCITANGALGIDLAPESPNPGNRANPNHDIDPPFNLSINKDGVVSGLVYTDTTEPIDGAACNDCLIQVFSSDPELLDGQGRDLEAVAQANPDGTFSAEVGSAPENGTQFVLTATDTEEGNGRNTSEFVTFEVTRSVDIEPPRTTIDAFPTQVITYFHTVTNTGTIDDDFALSGESSLGLDFTIEPAEVFSLAAGETQEVTVTLTLPVGSDERVRAGNTDLLTVTVTSDSDETVTDSVVDTTSIAGKIVIIVEPTESRGLVRAGEPVNYAHTITNVGNITATLNLSLDLTNTPPNWTTSLSGNTFTLPPDPDSPAQTVLTVTPPDSINAGAVAETLIRVDVLEDATENKVITDTTTVTTTALIALTPASIINFDGAAGRDSIFQHTITNLSNGPVTLQLVGSSSLGSDVTFIAISSDIQFGPDNTVTVPAEDADGGNVFTFQAIVNIPEDAGRGQSDILTIQVLDTSTGNIIASAQDITRIVLGRVKLWLPIAGRTR